MNYTSDYVTIKNTVTRLLNRGLIKKQGISFNQIDALLFRAKKDLIASMALKLSYVHWLFFDLGNTSINEERTIKDRIQQMVRAFAKRGMQVSAGAIERVFEEALTTRLPEVS